MESDTIIKALDFQDPGTLSDELLSVPGFINELKNYTLDVAARPNPPLAFAGALAMLTHLVGNTYRDERGNAANLYLVALAPSGMGKEEPRITNKRLAAEVGILHAIPDSLASGEGLEDAMALAPTLLLQADEADTLLATMHSHDPRAARLNEMILRFHSENKSGHAMRQRAGSGEVRIIPHPHLTLFATGIPKFVYGALNEKALENGLLGRCLFIESEPFYPLGEPKTRAIPTVCVETAREMVAREAEFRTNPAFLPTIVTESLEAKRKITELANEADVITKRLLDHHLGTAAALFSRIHEKIVKCAMLWAISENPQHPIITADAVIWATRFVTYLTHKTLFETQFYVSEGRFDALRRRAIALMTRAGGQISRSTLLRSLHVDSQTLQRVILTLHMCEMIEEEKISRNKIVYTLKN